MNISFRLIDRPDRLRHYSHFARVHYMTAAAHSGVMYKSHTSTNRSYKYLLLVLTRAHTGALRHKIIEFFSIACSVVGAVKVCVCCAMRARKRGSKISSIISLRCVMRALSFSFITQTVSRSIAPLLSFVHMRSNPFECVWCHGLAAR